MARYQCLFFFHRKYTVLPKRCHAIKVGLQGGIVRDCVRLPNTSRVTKRLSWAIREQPEGARTYNRLRAIVHPEFREETAHMALDRLDRDH